MQSNDRKKYNKSTFDNISEEKRKRFLTVAVSHFAKYGYDAANINKIAKDAGISVGSLYNYFESKEDLYFGVIDEGVTLLGQVLSQVKEGESAIDFYQEMLYAARDFRLNHAEFNQIYLNMTANSLSQMASRLCSRVECMTVQRYKAMLNEAQKRGELREDVDIDMAAYCMDNLMMMYHFSYASTYYRERINLFLGNRKLSDDEIIAGIVRFVERGLLA